MDSRRAEGPEVKPADAAGARPGPPPDAAPPREHDAPTGPHDAPVDPDDVRELLAVTIVGIAAALPAEQEELLGLARFADERAALARLSDPDWARLGALACTPAEAQRLLNLAQQRHDRLPRTRRGDPAVASGPAAPDQDRP